MSRALRRAGALLAACTLGVLLGPGVPAAQAAPAPPQAVQDFSSCLNGQHAGDLLLLIDESGSLGGPNGTDPEAARVKAANLLLKALAGQTEQAKIALDVQVAGFATNFDPGPNTWTPLTAANLPGLTDTVNGFAQRNTGDDTDYWLALEGARRSLADQAKAAGATEAGRCQAIAWFSDGKLDVEPRATAQRRQEAGTTVPYAPGVDLTTADGAKAATQAASDSLCRPGGLADQLRSSHIVMFGIGLQGRDAKDGDFDLMRAITTGVPYQGKPCGAITQPSPGTFQPVTDIDGLLQAFDAIVGPSDPVPDPDPRICAPDDQSCRGHEFVLDDSIDGFHILGQADAIPGLTAQLVGPDGAVHPLNVTDGSTADLSFGTVHGSYSWPSPTSVDIQIANQNPAADGWMGVWALRFVDPKATTSSGTSKTNLRIWSNIEPVWVGAKAALPSGAPVPDLRFELHKINNGPKVEPSSLRGTVGLNIDLVDPAGRATPVAHGLDKATIENPVTLDLTRVTPGPYKLRLSLDMTTAPAQRRTGETVPGTQLTTRSADLPLKVDVPLGYPTLPARIDFGSVEGKTELTAALNVTGPGCVWVPADAKPTVTTTPDGVSRVTITADGATSPQTCLKLDDGQAGSVTLHLQADHVGNGTAGGTLPVSIAPKDHPDQVRTVDVAFTGDLRTPINQLNRFATLIALLLLGPGIPLGLLYLFKWLTTKIPPNAGLYARLIPVTVEGGRTLRDNTPFGFRDGDFVTLADVPSGGTRRLVIGDVALRTRTGWSPFRAGYVSVEPANPRTVCLAPGQAPPTGSTSTGRLPLAVHRNWVVLHDPAGPPNAARVLVLVGVDMPADQRDAFAAEIGERLPEVLERLRTAVDQAAGPGGSGPGGPPAAPPYATAQYGPPPSGAPQSGTPQYGAPQYGAPQYGPAGTTAYEPAGASAYGPAGGTPTYGPAGTAPTYGPSGTATYGPADGTYGTPAGSAPGTAPGTPPGTPGYGTPTYGGGPDRDAGRYGAPPPAPPPAPRTTPSGNPGGGQYGPGAPSTPSYGAPTAGTPTYGPPGQEASGWDGRFGDDDPPDGATRPYPDGGGRPGPDPGHDPGRGPNHGPRG